ncbi:MAG: efflux RND transporter periplasmic adaptor subunit, partial [Verrucomicrobia bacterium]|nr:efflux RND transporter periplasmic adaptor subunit [Verrucomicrobiota bacterium]
MNEDKLSQLRIGSEQKRRPARSLWLIFLGVLAVVAVAAWFAWPRVSDSIRVHVGKNEKDGVKLVASADKGAGAANSGKAVEQSGGAGSNGAAGGAAAKSDDAVLTTSGYIVNRERIELSPRFLGVVKWIGVRKGDAVTNGQVVVLLDDAEYRARLAESEGQLDVAKVGVAKAELDFRRAKELVEKKVEMQKILDDAELQVQSAKAQVKQIEGAQQLVKTYLDWCIIRSPINGIVLEKLVDPNELVVPQSFGGTRGPSTALISVADPKDLQVEIDLNEADLAKVSLRQKCRVSPEAYPDKVFEGFVAEIAPEANRAKGTLQLKVQIKNP